MPTLSQQTSIKVADETWLVTALLHYENPQRTEFTVSEIVERAAKEQINGVLRPGVRVHATLHAVADLAPNPGRYRMLLTVGKSKRRLFRAGDPYHPAREGGKIVPKREDIPEKYHYLIDWFFSDFAAGQAKRAAKDSILALRGLGRELWADEEPDAYVRRLREGWQ